MIFTQKVFKSLILVIDTTESRIKICSLVKILVLFVICGT
jgi:hypothetical protein